MKKTLRILLVEDTPADAALVVQALDAAGLAFDSARVDNQESFLTELEQHPPDVILSDHGFPSFDGLTALAIARQRCPNVPVIVVSGSPRETDPARFIASGATDFVLKSHLECLAPALRRALGDPELGEFRRAVEEDRTQLIADLRRELARIHSLLDLIHLCSACRKVHDPADRWLDLEAFLQEQLHTRFTHGLCSPCMVKRFGPETSEAPTPVSGHHPETPPGG